MARSVSGGNDMVSKRAFCFMQKHIFEPCRNISTRVGREVFCELVTHSYRVVLRDRLGHQLISTKAAYLHTKRPLIGKHRSQCNEQILE